MGKYRDHRQPRREGLENDSNDERSEPSYFQRPSETRPPPSTPARGSFATQPAPSAPVAENEPLSVDAEVVWFNAAKGFGFVKLADGSEAYIHVSTLQAAGHDSVSAGDQLTVTTFAGPRGRQVAQVLSSRREGQAGKDRELVAPAIAAAQTDLGSAGTVRFYDSVRGFGFVSVEIGSGDVFVHASTLARACLATLELGQKVTVSIKQTPKGREAASIQLF